jgi:hypothetical protein
LPPAGRDVEQGAVGRVGGIVDEDVAPPVPLQRPLHDGVDLGRVGEVGGHAQHVETGGGQLVDGVVDRAGRVLVRPFARVAAHHDDVGAGVPKHGGRGPADAAGSAGNDGDGAVEREVVVGHGVNVPYRPTVR